MASVALDGALHAEIELGGSAGKSGVRTSSSCDLKGCGCPSLCSVRWPVSCWNRSLTPCVFSRDSLSVMKTLYGTLCVVSTSCEVVACRSRVCAIPTLRWSRCLAGFIVMLAVCTRNSPPLMPERCFLISWEDSTPVVSSPPDSRFLLDASCRCQQRERHRSLSPGCWDEMSHVINSEVNSAVLPTEEAADLLASAEAPRVFLDLEFAETCGCIFASYDACLTVACSFFGFVIGVTSVFSPSRRNREGHGWLWTPAVPISTSVLLSVSLSPRPHPLQYRRTALGDAPLHAVRLG